MDGTSLSSRRTPRPRRPRSPGPVGSWVWRSRWIPGFILAQVAVMLAFAGKAPGSFEGVPGGFGALLSVAAAIVCGPIAALGADAAGLTVRTDDDPDFLRVLAASAVDDGLVAGWRRHPIDTPAPGPEIVRTGRPIFIETRVELLARFPIVVRIEGDERFGGFAGVPVALGAEERRARATAEHAEDRLRKLQAVSDAANAATGLDELVGRVLPVVRDAVLAHGASFLLLSDDGRELLARGRVGAEEEADDTVIPLGPGASGRIAATGRPLVISELTAEDVISRALEQRRSYVGVPVRVGGRVVGVLHASSREPGAFDEDDADFLQSIADSLALTIDRARSFDQRDRMATALERALLPMSLPHVPGFEIATMYRPSRFGDEVGGDFYDVFGDGDVWYLAIGDVCGKGPEAAAIMGMTRIALRSLAREDDARPLSKVLELLNGFLLDSELMGDRFCTVCVARLELSNGRSTVTTCLGGHPPPLLVRSDGSLGTVGTPGSLLGLFAD